MKKRLLSLALLVIMLLGLFTGCGDEKTRDEESLVGKMVYQAELEKLELPYDLSWLSRYCSDGNILFFSGECKTGTEPAKHEFTGEPIIDEATGEPFMNDIYETKIFSLNPETHEVSVLENYEPSTLPEGMLGNSYMNNMVMGNEQTIWVMEEQYTYSYDLPEDFDYENAEDEYYMYYTPGETKYILRNLDSTGKTIKQLEIAQEEDFYPYSMTVDGSGNLYLSSYDKTVVMDPDGKQLFEIAGEEFSGELISLGRDNIGLLIYDYETGARSFRPIDLSAKGLAEEVELPEHASRFYPGFGSYAYLYDNYSDTVFGYNAETGESESLFSWMDCDISSDMILYYSVREDGTVLAFSQDYAQTEPDLELVTMKQVDASTVPQKTELTMACMWMDYALRSEIIKFNKNSSDVRIKVTDYSQYNTNDDPNGGLTRLNTEILSGKMPDLLMTNDMPIQQYGAQGLLTDLWTLIDNDGELSRDDLMIHFFETISQDGKLYEIFSTFAIETAVANRKYVGDRKGWTMEEMLQVLDTLEPGALILPKGNTKDNVLSLCLNRSLDSYIDWQKKTCSFDSQEFIDLLNFANTFPLEFNWEEDVRPLDGDFGMWQEEESVYMQLVGGKLLMLDAWISSFDDIQYAPASFGSDYTFIGYPSATGNGSSFYTYSGLAISASCKDTDLAWRFVRTFLTEEYQRQISYYEFPTNRHCFEEYAAAKMEQEYERDYATGEFILDENGNKIPITASWPLEDGTEFELKPMSQEQYDAFMELYESCTNRNSINTEINGIISAEVEAFFHGEKTAESTAAAIQNQVGLYLMEQA